MGLFGYNQKDFAKNTDAFQSKIDDLRQLILESGSRKYFGVGKVLDLASRLLGEIPFPKNANGKELQAVDERIFGLLSTLMDDIQNDSPVLVMAHAKMLNDALMKSRKFGKERLSAKELEAEKIVAETLAQMKDYMRAKGELTHRMKEIERESERLDEDDPEFDELDQEYTDLEKEVKQIERSIEVCRRRHDVNIDIINMRKDGQVYDKLPPQLASEADIDREIAKVNERASREDSYVDAVSGSLHDYNRDRDAAMGTGGSTSSLRAKRAMREQERLEQGIDDATVDNDGGDGESSGLHGLKRNK